MSFGLIQWFQLIIKDYGLVTFIFWSLLPIAFFCLLIYASTWPKLRPKEITYVSGHPTLSGYTNGRIEIEGENILFKSYDLNKTYLTIPLSQIADVKVRSIGGGRRKAVDFLSFSYLNFDKEIKFEFLGESRYPYSLRDQISSAMKLQIKPNNNEQKDSSK